MKKIPLTIVFLWALPLLFFNLFHLAIFAPFLAIAYHRLTLIKAVWVATFCGLGLDLINSQGQMGLYALGYCLATFVLYAQKRHFFEDKSLALSLFAALISATATLFHLALLHIFDTPIPFTSLSLFTDVILMALVDGACCFFWFACPLKAYAYIEKHKNEWLKRLKSDH